MPCKVQCKNADAVGAAPTSTPVGVEGYYLHRIFLPQRRAWTEQYTVRTYPEAPVAQKPGCIGGRVHASLLRIDDQVVIAESVVLCEIRHLAAVRGIIAFEHSLVVLIAIPLFLPAGEGGDEDVPVSRMPVRTEHLGHIMGYGTVIEEHGLALI